MNVTYDLAVIGSGFAGSLMAMIARRLGRSIVLLERGKHPRFAIGESSTPLANLLLEELARRYDLPNIAPLAKWGSWQRTYPKIGCGLKRGFTFYHHQCGQPFTVDPDRRNQLLVGASPNDEIADTHWYRPDFDYFLVREAQAMGVEYRDQVKLNSVRLDDGGATIEGEGLSVRARFVIDATGPRGFLYRALKLPEIPFEKLPPTQALFSHFTGVRRLPRFQSEQPPYPVDDAAVHHVFDGGWIWVLRFNNGITSAGVAATDRFDYTRGAESWEQLLERLPTVREQFADAKAVLPFVHMPRLSFRSGEIAGEHWALLPSAAGFVDPLLSTGFALTLLGISRLADVLEHRASLEDYATATLREFDATAKLVAALYASMADFPSFTALSLLYFAAMIYTETARRQGKPELARSFLLCDDLRFGPALRRCCELAGKGNGLIDEVFHAIKPIDLAGLSDRRRRNWHPAAEPSTNL